MAGNEMRSFCRIIPSFTSNTPRQRRLHLLDQLSEAGDEGGDAPLDRAHVEDLDDERVAGLGAADGDRPCRAVDPGHVDLGDEVVLAADLARETVVRLEGDDIAGPDLQHRLEIGPERPDHLATRESVLRQCLLVVWGDLRPPQAF